MNPPKGDNQAVKPWQKDLAEALKKASLGQKPAGEPNAALKAAIGSLSMTNKSSVAEALKKISAKPKTSESNPALRAAIGKAVKKTYDIPKAQNASAEWTKVAREHSGLKSKDLASTLQQIAAAQKGSKPAPIINRLIGLREPGLPSTLTEAYKTAFRAGLIRGMQETGSLNLNPWLGQTEIFRNSATDALREDWMLIERDLWTTVEKMSQQLEELPPQARVRLAKALAQYLRSHSAR
jgi:hypothetical protein